MDDVALHELSRLTKAAEPYPWRVEQSDGELVVVTKNGDPIASMPNDGSGRLHAKLIAAAPLLALRVLNSEWVKK